MVNVQNCSIKRNVKIRTLECLRKGVNINGDVVYIKPDVLFSRLTLLVKKEEERIQHFEHELTPEPAALFLHGKMRKPEKYKLRNHLLKVEEQVTNPSADVCVIDGGDLLFHTSWTPQSSYKEITENYVKYVNDNFKNPIKWVVFDGYSHKDSTKGEEQRRRNAGKKSATINFNNCDMKLPCKKDEFLKNRENKMQLIELLKATFTENDINTVQSIGDADTLICKVALQLAKEGNSVEVSGADTDLLIILIHHWETGMDLFFRTPRAEDVKIRKSKRPKKKVMWWNIGSIAESQPLRDFILFAHIWGGCDTTSGIFRHGKLKVLQLLKLPFVQDLAREFLNYNATPEQIGIAGNKLLPPTERSTHYHSLRVYLEVMKADMLNIECGLNPCDWGWKRNEDLLLPVMTNLPPAPAFLLNVIRCNCNTASKNTCRTMLCSCKTRCVHACGDCRGVACQNMSMEIMEASVNENDEFDDGNIFENLFDI